MDYNPVLTCLTVHRGCSATEWYSWWSRVQIFANLKRVCDSSDVKWLQNKDPSPSPFQSFHLFSRGLVPSDCSSHHYLCVCCLFFFHAADSCRWLRRYDIWNKTSKHWGSFMSSKFVLPVSHTDRELWYSVLFVKKYHVLVLANLVPQPVRWQTCLFTSNRQFPPSFIPLSSSSSSEAALPSTARCRYSESVSKKEEEDLYTLHIP